MITDYKTLIEHSYETARNYEQYELSKYAYLSEYIFQFTTYASAIAESLAKRAVEVCAAITDRTTFEYIRDQSQYEWFIVMCNMPFFADRIDWGGSIRGAWWNESTYTSTGLWVGDDQLSEDIDFTAEEWTSFVRAILEFARSE